MKDLTIKQYNQLQKVEKQSKNYVNRMKEWDPFSIRLSNYRRQFYNLAEQLGIFDNDGETIKYTCSALNLDFSYGYNFGDVLA